MSAADWTGRHRFFVEPESLQSDRVVFDRAQSHQLVRVLRVRPDERVIVLDGTGNEHLVRLTDLDAKSASGEILERRAGAGEPRTFITLYQALLPRDALELSLQKATECGISRFVPVVTERVVARAAPGDWSGRGERLARIAREAAEQSERARVPIIEAPTTLAEAVAGAASEGPVLVGWERGAGAPLRPVLQRVLASSPARVGILVGPEGGFSGDELELLRGSGAEPVWLGHRILRAETAGPVLTATVLYEAGEMGGAE